jgi:hypothetical protein
VTEPEPIPDDLTPDPPPPASTLTRVTFNALPRTYTDLQAVADLTGMSRTDVLNRAVPVYRFVEELSRQPGGFVVVRPDGKAERIWLL